MKVAVFGGSFNPVHSGHIEIIDELAKNYDEVWVIPCGNHAFGKELVKGEDRFKILELAIKNPRAKILDLQIKSSEKSFTYDLILGFQKKYPENKFFVVIGSDNLKDLNRWHNFDLLKKVVDFVVVTRPEYTMENLDIKIDNILKIKNESSSTYIRECLKKGSSLENLIPKEALEFIKQRRLYLK